MTTNEYITFNSFNIKVLIENIAANRIIYPIKLSLQSTDGVTYCKVDKVSDNGYIVVTGYKKEYIEESDKEITQTDLIYRLKRLTNTRKEDSLEIHEVDDIIIGPLSRGQYRLPIIFNIRSEEVTFDIVNNHYVADILGKRVIRVDKDLPNSTELFSEILRRSFKNDPSAFGKVIDDIPISKYLLASSKYNIIVSKGNYNG